MLVMFTQDLFGNIFNMKRLVETERWRDLFWNELHPYPKILLCYLYDNADKAGFIDYSPTLWITQLKGKFDNKYSEFTKNDLINSISDLKDKLVSNGKNKLFIKDFLKHQNKLPLIIGNEEHDWIITKLKSNLDKFNNAIEILDILNNHVIDQNVIKKNKDRTNKKSKTFVEPTFEELKEYYLSEEPNALLPDIQDIYDHYVSCGWTVGKNKPMVDWQSAVRKAIRNKVNFSNNRTNFNSNNNGTKKTSRTETTLSVVDELKQNV